MKTKHFLLLVLLPVIIISFIAFQQNQDHKVLFEKAKYSMETKGDLKEAITLFDSLIRTYPDERVYAANAQFHIGLCYEKLGNQAAQKAYQDVIKNYADQKDVVKIARQRLSQLVLIAEEIENPTISPKFTKINIPTEISWNVALSPDGQKLLLVYDKKLWLMPLAGNLGSNIPGKPEHLDTENIPVEWTGLSWSADGRWIAFNDILPKDSLKKQNWEQSIYIVPSEGGKPKKVFTNWRDSRVVNYRISLSNNGKDLAFSSIKNNEQYIYRIPVEGGNPLKLTDIRSREPVFSPDGKMIAFVEDQLSGIDGGNLMMIPATGGSHSVIAQAVNASSPIWSPDGSKIAFLDYSEEKKIFIVPVNSNGKPSGKKIAIDAPEGIEDVRLLSGWGPDNKIGALMSTKDEFAIYTLPEGGGQAAMVYNGPYPVHPRWTPDGKDILFMKVGKENPVPPNHKLSIVSAKGGQEKDIFIGSEKRVFIMPYEAGLRVSPDGEKILIAAKSWDDTVLINNYPTLQIWTITLEGEDPIQLTNPEIPFSDNNPYWSPDGKSFVFLRSKLSEDRFGFSSETSIYMVNSSGEDLKLLLSESDKWIGNLTWSPDGTMIAYITNPKDPPKELLLNVINVASGESSVIGKLPESRGHRELSWSPDCKRIAFKGHDENDVIKIMSIVDGSIENIETGLVDTDIHGLDWSPDGKSFVFVGYKAGKKEFWFMEDFLPLDKLKGTTQLESANDLEGIAVKQVWAGDDVDNTGGVSSDGKYISFVDWESGDLALRELKTNESWRLTSEANWEDPMHFALNNVISPDCKTIAYSWLNPNHTFALQTVNIQNPSPSILYNEEGEEIYPACWLSENELIVTRYKRESQISEILYFNILDKTLKELKPFERRNWPQISCSPDEQFIAYDFVNDNKGHWDINLLNKDGSEELSLIDHPANDRVLGWVPGRNEFLFISDRSGTQDLWAIPLKEGRPAGPVKLLYTDIGEVKPMGFTDNGDCFYGFSRRNFNASISRFNQETGEISDQLSQDILGSCIWVKWSPDGHYLAYIKENNDAENYWQLTLQDLHSGEEIELAKNLYSSMSPCWSPDGKSIIVVGRDKNRSNEIEYKGGIYHVDVKSGKTKEILLLSDYEYNSPEDDAFPLSDIEWSSDGKNIYYLFFKDRLVKHELETGKDITLFANPYFNRNVLKLSPDGKDLLFAVYDSDRERSHLFTLSVEEGVKKEICKSQQSNDFAQALWSKDGKYIFFTELNNGTDFWKVPVDGGEPEKIWHADNRTEVFSISPHGEEIASAIRERTTEVRVIENLVPELEKIYDVVY